MPVLQRKKILKRANPESASQLSLSPSPPGLVSDASSTHGASWSSPINSSNLRLGNLVQGQSGNHSRRAGCADQSCTNDHNGEFRGGAPSSLEKPVSTNSSQWEKWNSGGGSSGVGINTKPMVEVHHGLATNLGGGSRRTEQAKKAISGATLRQIRLVGTGKEGDRLQGSGLGTPGEHPHNEAVPNGHSSQEV